MAENSDGLGPDTTCVTAGWHWVTFIRLSGVFHDG